MFKLSGETDIFAHLIINGLKDECILVWHVELNSVLCYLFLDVSVGFQLFFSSSKLKVF